MLLKFKVCAHVRAQSRVEPTGMNNKMTSELPTVYRAGENIQYEADLDRMLQRRIDGKYSTERKIRRRLRQTLSHGDVFAGDTDGYKGSVNSDNPVGNSNGSGSGSGSGVNKGSGGDSGPGGGGGGGGNGEGGDESVAKGINKRIRLPPHINSVLRLIGGWLFESVLIPNKSFVDGQAVALLVLGRLFCKPRRHGIRATPSPPNSTRYIMALKRGLSTLDHGSAHSVVSVLRASHGVLATGIPGSHCLIRDLNIAMTKVLTSEDSHHLGMWYGGEFAFNDDISYNDHNIKYHASTIRNRSRTGTAGRPWLQRCFSTPYPLSGGLSNLLDIRTALNDRAMQRYWCLASVSSQLCFPSHFGDALALSERIHAGERSRANVTATNGSNDSGPSLQPHDPLKAYLARTPTFFNTVKEKDRQDAVLRTADIHHNLRGDLVRIISMAMETSLSTVDLCNLQMGVWQAAVLVQDAVQSLVSYDTLHSEAATPHGSNNHLRTRAAEHPKRGSNPAQVRLRGSTALLEDTDQYNLHHPNIINGSDNDSEERTECLPACACLAQAPSRNPTAKCFTNPPHTHPAW